MTVSVNEIEQSARLACKPPSKEPIWQWCERNVRITDGGMPGRYSLDLMPFVQHFYDVLQRKETKRVCLFVGAQCTKTRNGLNALCWSIAESPGLSMWVMASADNCKEFKKKRMDDAFDNCNALNDLIPSTKETNTRNIIMFRSMNLLLRGSNSRIGLQSDPVRRIYCDERREWKPGAIGMLRMRMLTFHNQLEVSMGVPGDEHDEWHADFAGGSQTFIHWNCEKCGHSQPFRFGRKPSPLFPNQRERGGFVWDENEITKPGGKWNHEEVAKTVRYECESCGHRYHNNDKLRLLKSWHPVHLRPEMAAEYPSIHWNAFYMPWSGCDWGKLIVNFLKSVDSMHHGDISPLKTFVTETMAEPWRKLTDDSSDRQPLLNTCGRYRMGDRWTQARDLVEIVTVDVQHGYLVYVHRQHRIGGSSRLVRAGRLMDEGELRAYQQGQGLQDKCIWLDSAYRQKDVGMWCLRFGWNALLGDDAESFHRWEIDRKTGKRMSVTSHWKRGEFDPGVGTNQSGFNKVARYSWSKPHYREMIFDYRTQGKGPLWEIADDSPKEYVEQMGNVIKTKEIKAGGIVEYQWTETGRHDFPDCECMQEAVSDIGGLKGVTS